MLLRSAAQRAKERRTTFAMDGQAMSQRVDTNVLAVQRMEQAVNDIAVLVQIHLRAPMGRICFLHLLVDAVNTCKERGPP